MKSNYKVLPFVFLFLFLADIKTMAKVIEFGDSVNKISQNKSPKLEAESTYVTMSDGTRIAVDVVHPVSESIQPKKYTTIIWSTRYWRSFELKFFPSPKNKAPVSHRGDLPDFFLRNGFAIAFVDVRGTGASEGFWSYPWAANERQDLGSVMDWISEKDWSNGQVATIGLSYEGSSALYAASTNSASLKAVVARQFEFDVYRGLIFPGGIFNKWFSYEWSEGNKALDKNGVPSFFPWYASFIIKGPRSIGGDFSVVEKIIEKRKVSDVYESLKNITYRDDLYQLDGNVRVTQDDFSPFSFKLEIEKSSVPLFTWGSWLDAATADSVIHSFVNFSNPQYAVIGAWDHMAEHQGSPYGDIGGAPVPDVKSQWQEMLKFIDTQVSNRADEVKTKKLIYYTMGEETWKQTDQWPPKNTREKTLYFAENNRLLKVKPGSKNTILETQFDNYQVDFQATTGTNNRWHTEMAKKVNYGSREKADKRLLTYTSDILTEDLEITGHPVVELFVQSSRTDAAVYVYLEDVHPNGKVTHITDGQLRALHRKISTDKPLYKSFGPIHSYKRADAMPIEKNKTVEMSFSLLPTSVLIRKGHRIRIAIAGHDKDTFARIPEKGELLLRMMRNKEYPSRIILPVSEQ